MSDEAIHKKIEEHIVANMPNDIKYSLTHKNPRDFTLPNAPLLSDGEEPFIIFQVAIQSGSAAAIGNTTKRRMGIVRAELHLDRDATDRDAARMVDKITPFLERTNFNGVLLKDASGAGEFERGKWLVRPWTFNFKTTITLT